MYCVYGASGSTLLIESRVRSKARIESMIINKNIFEETKSDVRLMIDHDVAKS